MAGKPRTARRVIKDALISATAIGVLLLGLVAMDARVRDQVSLSMDTGYTQGEVAASGAQAHKLATVVVQVVKDQSQEHGPLMLMLAVGLALALVMFRT